MQIETKFVTRVVAVAVLPLWGLAIAGCGGAVSDAGGDREDQSVVENQQGLSLRSGDPRDHLEGRELLGRFIFEDTTLSASGTQSCSSCHEAGRAFTGNNRPNDPLFPVATGAFPNLIGVRNAPTAMYMGFSPTFAFVDEDDELTPTGGQFWDGRADTLADQAKGPFLNPREMAMPSKAAVVDQIKCGPYASLFLKVFGRHAFEDVDKAYDRMAQAVESFELTGRFQPFTSKFDAVLRGRAKFTGEELRGFKLFKDPEKGNCIGCHAGDVGSRDPVSWLFTDFTYDNLGVPRNSEIPDNVDPTYYDLGLCNQPGIRAKVPTKVADPDAFVSGLCGAFKVPTLRNVAKTAPYMHNGFFKKLRDVVSFYVTRDTNPAQWYPTDAQGAVQKFNDLPAQHRANVNTSEVPYDRGPGDEPRLSSREVDDVVAFLNTLTDGYAGR